MAAHESGFFDVCLYIGMACDHTQDVSYLAFYWLRLYCHVCACNFCALCIPLLHLSWYTTATAAAAAAGLLANFGA